MLTMRCHGGLSSSKVITTSSLYKFLTSGGVSPNVAKKLWKCRVPLKIQIFIWQAHQDRLHTRQQLKVMEWRESERCFLCDEHENADHLLFRCPLAEFVWAFMKEALGCDGYPRSMRELLLPAKFGVSYQSGLTCFARIAWALWNRICIQRRFLEKPSSLVCAAMEDRDEDGGEGLGAEVV
jgi:hypothetical protein